MPYGPAWFWLLENENKENCMKLAMIAAAVAAGITMFGATSTVSAQDIRVGPGGVRIDRDRDYNRGNCRVIIDRHRNDRGEDVTVRRRVCD